MFKETGLCSCNILLHSCLRLLCETQRKTSVVGRLWGNIPFPKDFLFLMIKKASRQMTGDNWGMDLPHKRRSLEEETFFLVCEEFVSNMQLCRCSDVYFTPAHFRVAKKIYSNVPEPNLLFQFVAHTHLHVAELLRKVKQMPDEDF